MSNFHHVTAKCPGTNQPPVEGTTKTGTPMGNIGGRSFGRRENPGGRCPDCGRTIRVKKDGTMMSHKNETGEVVDVRTGKRF